MSKSAFVIITACMMAGVASAQDIIVPPAPQKVDAMTKNCASTQLPIAALEATTSHTDEGAFQETPAATGSGFVIYIVARTELFWAHELSE